MKGRKVSPIRRVDVVLRDGVAWVGGGVRRAGGAWRVTGGAGVKRGVGVGVGIRSVSRRRRIGTYFGTRMRNGAAPFSAGELTRVHEHRRHHTSRCFVGVQTPTPPCP